MRQAEERRAYLEGLEILTTLVNLLPVDDPRWLEIVEVVPAQAEWTIDQRVEVNATEGLRAMQVLESVLEHSPDLARRAAVKYRLGLFVGWGAGDLRGAARLLGEARDLYGAAGDQRSVVVSSGLIAYAYTLAGDPAAMEAEAAVALAAADQLGEPLLAASALGAQLRTAVLAGRFDAAHALQHHAAAKVLVKSVFSGRGGTWQNPWNRGSSPPSPSTFPQRMCW